MGRFDSTAASYAAYREPYPPAFFAEAAASLHLSGREALIDLGTGPGLLALGFKPYVASVVGVDPEPAMVAAARANGLRVVEGRAEDVDFGPFDVVAIGRALHWMERAPTLAALDRMLAPGGRIFVCAARNTPATAWRAAFDAVTQAYSTGEEARNHRAHQQFFDGSGFVASGDVAVESRQRIGVEALIERALTRSTTSPAALGPRVAVFRAAMREALAPWFAAGEAEETVEARGRIFMRPK